MTNFFDDVFAIIRKLELAIQRLPDQALRFEMYQHLIHITAKLEQIQLDQSNGAGIEVVTEQIEQVIEFLQQLDRYLELY